MNSEFSLLDIISTLKKWKKQILYGTAIITLVSIVVSLFMPNYYKAETIFYAASPDLAEPIPIGDQNKNIRIYGDNNDLDRLFTIALSYEVIDFLVDSFDLYNHYDIDVTNAKASFKVKQKFQKNYQTIKTKYGALQLMVEDKDPVFAAKIANAAREKIGQIAQEIVKESQRKLLNNYESNLEVKQNLSDSLSSILLKLKSENNILDSRSQGDIYTSIITRTTADLEEAKAKFLYYKNNKLNKDSIDIYASRAMGYQSKLDKINEQMTVYAANVFPIRQIEQEQARIIDQISLDKERFKQLKASVNAPFTALHLVETAQIPVEKSRPKRSVWVILATILGFFMCCMAVFMIESYKDVDFKSL